MMDHTPQNSNTKGDGLLDQKQFGKNLDAKSNQELLAELDAYILAVDEKDLDSRIVDAYLDKLQERAPIEAGDEAAARAKLPWHVEPTKKAHKKHRVLRVCSVAAAIVLLLCVVAGALGYNPFLYVWNWTEETILYRFNPSGDLVVPEELESEYRTVQEALDKLGFDIAAAPTWIPSDCALYNVTVRADENLIRLTAFYKSDSRSFRLQISQTDSNDTSIQGEKIEDEFSYESNGTTYLIHVNTDSIKAMWQNNSYLCTIYGELSQKELTHIIDSISR